MTYTAVLSNRDAIIRADGENEDGSPTQTVTAGPEGYQATEVVFPDDTSLAEAFTILTAPAGVWAYHAAAGHVPAWVASDFPGLADLLVAHFTDGGKGPEVRDLLDPYDPANRDHSSASAAAAEGAGGGGGSTFLPLMLLLPFVAWVLLKLAPMLKVNTGNDFQAAQMGGSASATAVAKWVGLTANSGAAAAGDTTLTGEITTGGGGLIRKAGTYAHTTGAASYTITTVFTANGSDALPVTIAKRGIFDAVTGGNLVFETLLSSTATLSASGDQLTLTDTITL